MIYSVYEEDAIEFLKANGVEVRYEPVAYMTPEFISPTKYVFGEQSNTSKYVSTQEKLSISEAVNRVRRQIEICNRMSLKGNI